jgi:hypothetical protein
MQRRAFQRPQEKLHGPRFQSIFFLAVPLDTKPVSTTAGVTLARPPTALHQKKNLNPTTPPSQHPPTPTSHT